MYAAESMKNANATCLNMWRTLVGSGGMPIDRVAKVILSCADAERHGRACSCQRVFFPQLVETAARPC